MVRIYKNIVDGDQNTEQSEEVGVRVDTFSFHPPMVSSTYAGEYVFFILDARASRN